MAFISTTEDTEATNYERVFNAHRPDVYAAWRQLVTAVSGNMEPRLYELATLAAARRLRSSYCALSHGKVLAEQILDWDTVGRVARGDRTPLDEVEVAVMEFAEQIVADAASVTREDVDRLRALGLSGTEVFDVAAAAAARCFFSKLLDALGTEPDSSFAELEPEVRDALVVGRPIASA